MPTQEEIDEAKKYLDDNKYLSYGWGRELAILSEAYDAALSEIARRQAWLEQKEQQLSTMEELVGKQEKQISSITTKWEGTIRELEKAEKRIAELEAQLASAYVLDPRHVYERQPGAPDWMLPAVKCRVWDKEYNKYEQLITRYVNPLKAYMDECGLIWRHAEPIEKAPKWIPTDDEPVAYWREGKDTYHIALWDEIKGCEVFPGQAISHWSGQRDMRVEALKDEPRYEP